jgi:hypothetical protein
MVRCPLGSGGKRVIDMSCEHSVAKFQDEITHVLWDMTLDSSQDDNCGESDGIGWHALFSGPIFPETATSLNELIAGQAIIGDLSIGEFVEMDKCYGAIVREDSQGFVESTLYSNADELKAAWQAILDADERYHAESSDND